MNYLKIILKTLKVSNYKKNIVILFPLFFSGDIFSITFKDFTKVLTTLIAFCLLTSLVYIMNDLFDKESDKTHPVKKYRPIASEAIVNRDIVILIIFLILCESYLFLNSNTLRTVSLLFGIYFLNNVLYNLFLKKINIIVSSFVISIGFYIRLLIGAVIIDIELTIWLSVFVIISTFIVSYLKKLSDMGAEINEDYYRDGRKVSYFFIFLIIAVYFIHLYSYNLINLNLAFLFNAFLFIYSVVLVMNFFFKNNGPKDPVDLFGLNIETFFFIIWFLSYFQIRFNIV